MSVAALHPAERRRLAAQMPPQAPHPVTIRPLGNAGAASVIVTSAERNFVAALLADLAADDWQDRLAPMRRVRVNGDDGVLELNLPIHSRFQVAVFEAVCATPGSPRVDPRRLTATGMVLRRRTGGGWQGWMRREGKVAGWLPVSLSDADPDPARALASVHPANAAVRTLIAARAPAPTLVEDVIPLYVAPPAVCAARGRTILFGVIPVVSSEGNPAPGQGLDYTALPDADQADMVDHLSGFLKARPAIDLPYRTRDPANPDPDSDRILSADWNVLDQPKDADGARLQPIGTFLYQLAVELDAFGGGAAATELLRVLGGISLPTAVDQYGAVTDTVDAATFATRAAAILVNREGNSDDFRMPLSWPRVDDALGARLTRAALDCLTERHAALNASPPKFDDPADRFAVRAFARVKGHDGCPDKLVWMSDYSEDFHVLPWWDGDGPGTKITLPSLSQLKKVKPNVSFAMPPQISNLLAGDMSKLKDGEGSTSDLGVGWLCSFSIPIITLCAFIVLNIFLSLFDLIFRWMILLKICIPIPKKGG